MSAVKSMYDQKLAIKDQENKEVVGKLTKKLLTTQKSLSTIQADKKKTPVKNNNKEMEKMKLKIITLEKSNEFLTKRCKEFENSITSKVLNKMKMKLKREQEPSESEKDGEEEPEAEPKFTMQQEEEAILKRSNSFIKKPVVTQEF